MTEPNPVTILHLSDIQFGHKHRFGRLAQGDPDAPFDTLLGADLRGANVAGAVFRRTKLIGAKLAADFVTAVGDERLFGAAMEASPAHPSYCRSAASGCKATAISPDGTLLASGHDDGTDSQGGVGTTSLVYHLAWMYADLGLGVVAADLDPQANLTSMFLDEDRLEELWPDGEHPQSVLGAIRPILKGTGDIAEPHVEDIRDNLGLIVGDLGLSLFEDKLSDAWPRCHDRDEAAFGLLSGPPAGRQGACRTVGSAGCRPQPRRHQSRCDHRGRAHGDTVGPRSVLVAGAP
jgi:hypothetical protein